MLFIQITMYNNRKKRRENTSTNTNTTTTPTATTLLLSLLLLLLITIRLVLRVRHILNLQNPQIPLSKIKKGLKALLCYFSTHLSFLKSSQRVT